MGSYLASVWRCRYFWLSLARLDLMNRYRRSMLGIGWSLLNPVAMALVLCVVFNKLFQLDARDFWLFLLAGLSFWNFIAGSVMQGCQAFRMGESYIRQHRTPLAIYPLRTVLSGSFHLILALLVVAVISTILHGGADPTAWVSLVPALGLILVLAWSLAVVAGLATVYFPDVQHLSEIGLSILFYATPIIYPTTLLRERGLGWLVDYNPLASFADLVRQPLLAGEIASGAAFATATVTAGVAALAAGWLLSRFEHRLVFHL